MIFESPYLEVRNHPALGSSADELQSQLSQLVEGSGAWESRLHFDQRLARGLAYYTGLVFELRLPGYNLDLDMICFNYSKWRK